MRRTTTGWLNTISERKTDMTFKKTMIAAPVALGMALALAGCGTSQPERAQGGAAGGAAAGAAVGAVGGPIGALAGAGIGAVGGAVAGSQTTPQQVNLGPPPKVKLPGTSSDSSTNQ
jgi:hypothetical protein